MKGCGGGSDIDICVLVDHIVDFIVKTNSFNVVCFDFDQTITISRDFKSDTIDRKRHIQTLNDDKNKIKKNVADPILFEYLVERLCEENVCVCIVTLNYTDLVWTYLDVILNGDKRKKYKYHEYVYSNGEPYNYEKLKKQQDDNNKFIHIFDREYLRNFSGDKKMIFNEPSKVILFDDDLKNIADTEGNVISKHIKAIYVPQFLSDAISKEQIIENIKQLYIDVMRSENIANKFMARTSEDSENIYILQEKLKENKKKLGNVVSDEEFFDDFLKAIETYIFENYELVDKNADEAIFSDDFLSEAQDNILINNNFIFYNKSSIGITAEFWKYFLALNGYNNKDLSYKKFDINDTSLKGDKNTHLMRIDRLDNSKK